MLTSDSPTRRASQAGQKQTPCIADCGTLVLFRTNRHVLCRPCSALRKNERARISAHKQRRKLGVPRVKGVLKSCARCSCLFELNRNAHALHCSSCAYEHSLEKARVSSRRRAATAEGRAAASRYTKKKRETDPSFRVSSHMKVQMHRALNGRKAGRSWRQLVPYSLEQLMDHLERQFLPGMTWENKGKWHIDHIRPLSSFKFEKPEDAEFQDAWSLANLRPLWGRDNVRKQAKRTHLI